MRALILGVGDAFTEKGCGTSAVLETPLGGYLLIDCPDLIHRTLKEASTKAAWSVDASRIDDIIITHLHGDHCNGLESFGFSRLVSRMKGINPVIPRLHTHPAAARRVWERLAPAMDAPIRPGGRPARLDDYFELHVIEPESPASIAGFTVECRYTIHPIPTIGLKISDGRSTLSWSGDTVFEQAHIDWLASGDIIVHEANLGPAHTQIETLNNLPPELRRKMRVTHITDGFDPSCTDIRVLEEGQLLEL